MSREPSRRYVELAVCEDCGRIFHPASMRGSLCMSCAAKRPDPSKPPMGFVEAVCKDCGQTFAKPRSASTFYCWKCADRRRKKAERLRRRRLAERPVVFEDAVCEDCGQTFRRPSPRLLPRLRRPATRVLAEIRQKPRPDRQTVKQGTGSHDRP